MPMIKCPAGCGREQREDQFLCLPCWSHLPPIRKSSIRRAWEDLRTIDKERSSVDFLRAMRAYRWARSDALGYLRSFPATTPERKAVDQLFNDGA